jgi:hypothetical protein
MIFRRAKALRLIPKGKKQRLVEVGAALEVPAGSADELAPAVLQAGAAGGAEAGVMFGGERAGVGDGLGWVRDRVRDNVRSVCRLHQEIVAQRDNFSTSFGP